LSGVLSTISGANPVRSSISSAKNSAAFTSTGVSATILNSEDYTLKEQVQAFKEIEKSLQGDTVALQAFRDSYQHLVTFTTMNPIVLDFIEDKGLTNDQINNMYSA
jgi:hypothetical protein